MKKLIMAAVFTIVLSACGNTTPPIENIQNSVLDYRGKSHEIWIIEDCEYIIVGHGTAQMMSHMGTCKNPIHKQIVHDTVFIDQIVNHSQNK